MRPVGLLKHSIYLLFLKYEALLHLNKALNNRGDVRYSGAIGGVREWLKRPVSKTGIPQGIGSSNLPPSANSGAGRSGLYKEGKDIFPKENVDVADGCLAYEDAEQEFIYVYPQRSARVTYGVRRQEGRHAP